MGLLVDGVWQDDRAAHQRRPFHPAGRRFPQLGDARRQPPGHPAKAALPPTAGRYHLYVSLACPWAHRTIIFRKLKALEDVISMSVVSPDMGRTAGPSTRTKARAATTSTARASSRKSMSPPTPHYTGRVSVPVLWDKKSKTIVNNESSEIIRMLNSAFDAFTNVADRLLSESAARRDRPHQRPRLSKHQQRRLSRRLCHHASGLRGSVPRRCSTRSTRSSRVLGKQRYLAGARSPKPTGGCSAR